MTKIVQIPTSPAKRIKLSGVALQKMCQLAAEYDLAVKEHRMWSMRLAIATKQLAAFVDKVGRPTMARAVRAGQGPMDKFGDALYGLCQRCGGLVTRYINTKRGESIGMGHPTERCLKCKPVGRKS